VEDVDVRFVKTHEIPTTNYCETGTCSDVCNLAASVSRDTAERLKDRFSQVIRNGLMDLFFYFFLFERTRYATCP
jgi:hypothetical protein